MRLITQPHRLVIEGPQSAVVVHIENKCSVEVTGVKMIAPLNDKHAMFALAAMLWDRLHINRGTNKEVRGLVKEMKGIK